MNSKEIIQSLNSFQKDASLTNKVLGYVSDTSVHILGILVEMRNICNAAEKDDTILLHKHMGISAWHIANFATLNSIKLSKAIGNYTYDEMLSETVHIDIEDYFEELKDEISFVSDMTDESKEMFIKKTWISIFIESYQNDFRKVDRILKQNIEDNKIKYPKLFSIKGETLKHGLE